MTTQATPPSEAQQLADARTALAVHIARIAELERIASSQRSQIVLLLNDNDRLKHAISVLSSERDELERHCGELGTALAVVEETL